MGCNRAKVPMICKLVEKASADCRPQVENDAASLQVSPRGLSTPMLRRNRLSAFGKRKWSNSQIGRLNPTGTNTPVKKVVGSVAQVGNQDDR